MALLADLLDRFADPVDRAHPVAGSCGAIAQGIPGRRRGAAVVWAGLEGGTMLHLLAAQDVPLFDQGAIQFILLTLMILVVAFLIWLTIPRWPRAPPRRAARS